MGDGKVFFGTIDNNQVALDQNSGQEVWRVTVDDPRQCGCNIGAAPLVAGGKAKLWSYQTGAGNRGSAISYAVNGRQYTATPTGWRGSLVGDAAMSPFPDQHWRMGSTLVVFALPK